MTLSSKSYNPLTGVVSTNEQCSEDTRIAEPQRGGKYISMA
jgi:hypothetical protein